MRNLKFRVWDTYLKKMSSGAGLTVAFKDGKLTEVSYDGETSSWSAMPDCLKNNRFIAQLSTGIKDKNGVDIYESDIIQFIFTDKNIINSPIIVKQEIKWMNSTHRFMFDYPTYSEREYEVIGNIYENPELVKK